MSMIDLKRTKAEIKKLEKGKSPVCELGGDIDEYPYGPNLLFNDDLLKKVPALRNVKVGQLVTIKAVCKITSVRSNEVLRDGKPKEDAATELQMQKIEVSGEADEQEAFDKDEASEKD